MPTTQEWWDTIKQDPARLIVWLRKQFHGEITAADRIERYCIERLPPEHECWRSRLKLIAAQERKHAVWVGDLLRARDVAPEIMCKDERYWKQTLIGIRSFEDAAAVAAHAEEMRLERITLISFDPQTPMDIGNVFRQILPEEQFHMMSFRRMAGEAALARSRAARIRGMGAIGLVTTAETI